MEVSVKLVGMLVDAVPAGGPLGARPLGIKKLELDHGISVAALVTTLGLSPEAEYFAMVNETHVPVDRLSAHTLEDGDKVVLCPPLKGG